MNKQMFLIAVSGTTKCGRILTDDEIFTVGSSYNTEYYKAIITSGFGRCIKVLGEVRSLKAEMSNGKAHLYAEVAISKEFLEHAAEWEVFKYFMVCLADVGVQAAPYLIGLGITEDSSFIGVDAINHSVLSGCLLTCQEKATNHD